MAVGNRKQRSRQDRSEQRSRRIRRKRKQQGIVDSVSIRRTSRTPSAAIVLAAIYRNVVPQSNDLDYNIGLKRFLDQFAYRVERLASAPRPPWFRFMQQRRAAQER